MNILISSTRQWNPGDEFIRMGVQNLLAEHIGNDHNLILWNRNPDLFIDGYVNDNVKDDFSTNSAKPSDLQHIDCVVFAGTPEWLGGPVRAVMDYLYANPEVPCLFIGIGSGRPLTMLTERDRQVLQRDNCLIIARSIDLDSELNQLLGTEKAITLPCPALFVAKDPDSKNKQINTARKAIIIQIDKDLNHSISTELVEEFFGTLTQRDDIEIFTFYINEHTYLAEQSIASKYSYEPNDYLRWLSDYSVVISTRLHGAIAALSLGVPSILVASDDNIRIRTTQGLYTDDRLPIVNNFAAALALADDVAENVAQLHQFKSDTKASYQAILGPWLQTHLKST